MAGYFNVHIFQFLMRGEARFVILRCSDSDPAKSFGSFWIRIRIHSTDKRGKLALQYYVVQILIRIQQKVPDSFGFG
jgi:hypothetical protein